MELAWFSSQVLYYEEQNSKFVSYPADAYRYENVSESDGTIPTLILEFRKSPRSNKLLLANMFKVSIFFEIARLFSKIFLIKLVKSPPLKII